jgi:hypothetical protein
MNTCVCLKERNLKRGFIVGWGRFFFRASRATPVPEQQHHIRARINLKCVLCVFFFFFFFGGSDCALGDDFDCIFDEVA